jgi:hypothetical protein
MRTRTLAVTAAAAVVAWAQQQQGSSTPTPTASLGTMTTLADVGEWVYGMSLLGAPGDVLIATRCAVWRARAVCGDQRVRL